jgi:N-acyl homoserine lactone hydrolase
MNPLRTLGRSAQLISALLCSLWTLTGVAQTTAPVTLTRLDCGNRPEPVSVAAFSDTFAYEGLKLQLTYSCYLIRHGDEYMIWDTGNPPGRGPESPRTSLVDLLAQLQLTPDRIKYVGISHYHNDHTGQAASFPHATLLIGKGDWDVLTATQPPQDLSAEAFAARRTPFAPWISGGSRVEPQAGDKKDVFGDGTVVMISTPGHTPGHHSLLVRLKEMGNVLLSGDATHFHENYATNGLPTWNFNRADTLASLDRLKQIAQNLHAALIIQHDARDITKLPAFPAAAR